MKRICSILLALCAFAACFTWLAACSRTFVTEYTVNTDYDALDSGSIVLGEDVNGVPISEFSTDEVHVPIRAPFSGGTYKTNLNGVAVTAPGINLKAGFYRFGVSARTVPANGDRVMFEMRVIAPERKEVLGNFSVCQYAFTTEEYEVKEMSFYLEQDAEINLQIFTQNQYDFYVNRLYVRTVPEEECTVQDIAGYMRSDGEEI